MVLSLKRFVGKVAVVTGASSGIGATIAKHLVKKGLIVVGMARRIEMMQEIASELSESAGKLYGYKVDLLNEKEIIEAFKWVEENVGAIHVLINNAGTTNDNTLYNGDTKAWKTVLDLNVLSVCITTREAIKYMRENEINGHIIHINSIYGHKTPSFVGLNIYAASKYAVTALTEELRNELKSISSKIKITSISPGVVESELTSGSPNPAKRAFYATIPILKADDVADAVMYALSTAEDVLIFELIIKPMGELD